MNDAYIALGTAATVAPVIVTIVYQLRALFPRALTSDRTPPVAIVAGAALMGGAWALRFTPPAMDWREALLIGLAGGVKAMGIWSATKAMTKTRLMQGATRNDRQPRAATDARAQPDVRGDAALPG